MRCWHLGADNAGDAKWFVASVWSNSCPHRVDERIPTWDTVGLKAASRMMAVPLVALVRTEKVLRCTAFQCKQYVLVENKRGLERTTSHEI